MLRIVDIGNAFEAKCSVHQKGDAWGNAIDMEKHCPEGFSMIIDAEGDLVAFVREGYGRPETINELLNWADENYPAEARD